MNELVDYPWKKVYFKPSEVVEHNCPEDCWISWNWVVRDLTPLIKEFRGTGLEKPLIAEAGKDISHWFDKDGEFRRWVHPVTFSEVVRLPHGPLPHISDVFEPSEQWRPTPPLPWWKDPKYCIGLLTRNSRPIRIKNVLSKKEVIINVCEEETINEILTRYLVYNENATSYTWKFEGKKVDMEKTLNGNCILDKRETFKELGLPEDLYIPCLMLYYDDNIPG